MAVNSPCGFAPALRSSSEPHDDRSDRVAPTSLRYTSGTLPRAWATSIVEHLAMEPRRAHMFDRSRLPLVAPAAPSVSAPPSGRVAQPLIAKALDGRHVTVLWSARAGGAPQWFLVLGLWDS